MTTDIVETTLVRAFVDLDGGAKSKAAFVAALNKAIGDLKTIDYVPDFDVRLPHPRDERI